MKNISVLCAAAAVLVSIVTAMAENEKPVIINQPVSTKAKVGDSVTFSIVAKDVNTTNGKNFTTSIMGTTKLEMIWCPPGTFMMGSPANERGRDDNETLHQVTLTKGFWMGKYEVTEAQWNAVYKIEGGAVDMPKDGLYWGNVIAFCDRLTKSERAAGRISEGYKYTLPTEAQWEYACRAGTTTALNSGYDLMVAPNYVDENVDEVAWYNLNAFDGALQAPKLQKVGQKLPNAWGFYDMHGNIAEWCLDRHEYDAVLADYGSDAATDPYINSENNAVVCRGGSVFSSREQCRSASRGYSSASNIEPYLGFRIVLIPVE